MTLGKLAKDSFLDLETLAKEQREQQQKQQQQQDSTGAAAGGGENEACERDVLIPNDDNSNNGANPQEEQLQQTTTLSQAYQPRSYPTNPKRRATAASGYGIGYHDDVPNVFATASSSSDDDDYNANMLYHSSYSAPVIMTDGAHHHAKKNDLCNCLFPFAAWWKELTGLSSSQRLLLQQQQQQQQQQERAQLEEQQRALAAGASSSTDADEVASNASSDNLGERLSDKERQAVLARLRLAAAQAPPDESAMAATMAAGGGGEHQQHQQQQQPGNAKGLLNGMSNAAACTAVAAATQDPLAPVSSHDKKKPLKGILRRRTMALAPPPSLTAAASLSFDNNGSPDSASAASSKNKNASCSLSRRHTTNCTPAAAAAATASANNTGARRSLFPSYETSSKKSRRASSYGAAAGVLPPQQRHQSAPTAPVVPTTIHHVQFSPMARVVTVKSKNDMTMAEKGDIWWQKTDYEDFRKTGRIITRAMHEGGSEIWLENTAAGAANKKKNNGKVDGKNKNKNAAGSNIAGDVITAPQDKWWHKFGHSRRGLEHVVSMEEGRQRQANVKTALCAVLEEQAKQKMYKRRDSEKLRIISLNHTTWARDLALASGSSDADAVETSFALDRKSREFYLLKMARTNPNCALATAKTTPEFMYPVGFASSTRSNASAGSAGSGHHRRAGSSSDATSTTNARLPQQSRLDAHTATQIRYRQQQQRLQQQQHQPPPKPGDSKKPPAAPEKCEPIRDRPKEGNSNRESISKRAAGFSVAGEQKVNMAAVLSGMGPIPRDQK